MRDEIIIRILDKASRFVSMEQIKELRDILEDELYNYTVSPACTALAVINDMPGRVMLFLASKKLDGCSPRTIDNYSRILEKFCNAIHKDVAQIDSMDIKRYQFLYSKRGVKNSTMATIISCLKSFFGWLENEEYIPRSPMRKIKNIKVEKRVRKALNREELEMLRDACETSREKALVEFFYSTGCRLDEVQKLSITDVDWSNGKVLVIGKGNKERKIYMTPAVKQALTQWLAVRSTLSDILFTCS